MPFLLAPLGFLQIVVRWDIAWFYAINVHGRNGLFDLLMPVLSDFSLWRWPLLAAALLAVIVGNRKTRVTVLLAIIAVVLADQVSGHLLKPLIARPRPSHVLEGVRLLSGRGGRYGFPSSHAANIFAIWALLALRHIKLSLYLLIIPLGVAYSRVYVGVHYPLDVFGGAVLGGIIALGVWGTSQRAILKPLAKRTMRSVQGGQMDVEKVI